MSEVFKFGGTELDLEHNVGDPKCSSCMSDNYPKPCSQPGCTGLIHLEGEEIWDNEIQGYDYFTRTKCDACGNV